VNHSISQIATHFFNSLLGEPCAHKRHIPRPLYSRRPAAAKSAPWDSIAARCRRSARQPPSSIADLAEGQEIRNFIRRQKSPIDFVSQTSVRPQRLGAVLTSRPFLCGLSDTEWNVVRERARTAQHPEQAQMQQSLTKALDELRLALRRREGC
jgi:hypothetical protein